jgi:serine/threonine protein kinase
MLTTFLTQATRSLEPLPEAAILVLFSDLLHGLAACHAAGVIHLVRL